MPRFDDGRIQYYCGSGESWQSSGCRSAARIKKLESEVERLLANLQRAVEIASEFWDNQKQAVLVYHQELADELAQLKAAMNHDTSEDMQRKSKTK